MWVVYAGYTIIAFLWLSIGSMTLWTIGYVLYPYFEAKAEKPKTPKYVSYNYERKGVEEYRGWY
jgi:hypothetical protein